MSHLRKHKNRDCLQSLHGRYGTPTTSHTSTNIQLNSQENYKQSYSEGKTKSNGCVIILGKGPGSTKTFPIFFRSGKTNRGNYFSKNHPSKHHCKIRPVFLIKAI